MRQNDGVFKMKRESGKIRNEKTKDLYSDHTACVTVHNIVSEVKFREEKRSEVM